MSAADRQARIVGLTLDQASIGRAAPDVEHDRAVAIYDLLEENSFAVRGAAGPYRLVLSLAENRLVLDINAEGGEPLIKHALSLSPFRKVVKDYFLVCDSYHQAIRSGSPSRIEAIDMGRRALHNEGSQVLIDRLDGKVDLDFGTARRLFTLICVLHRRS